MNYQLMLQTPITLFFCLLKDLRLNFVSLIFFIKETNDRARVFGSYLATGRYITHTPTHNIYICIITRILHLISCITALAEKRSTATGAIAFQEKIEEICLQAKVAGRIFSLPFLKVKD